MWKKLQRQGALVVLVDGEGSGSPAECRRAAVGFRRQYHLTMPVLVDPHDTASKLYRVRAIPTNVVIGRKGIVRYWAEGYDADAVTKALGRLGLR